MRLAMKTSESEQIENMLVCFYEWRVVFNFQPNFFIYLYVLLIFMIDIDIVNHNNYIIKSIQK